MPSFFDNGEKCNHISINNTKLRNQKLSYISELTDENKKKSSFLSSSIFPNNQQIKRRHFIKTINTWLNEYNLPLDYVDNGFYNYDIQNKINEIEDVEIKKNRENNDDLIACILEIIKKKKYKVVDETQFKEDITFFNYSLS